MGQPASSPTPAKSPVGKGRPGEAAVVLQDGCEGINEEVSRGLFALYTELAVVAGSRGHNKNSAL